ncbi:hydroxyurea phosphotransferase [Streptomyces sp. PKU-EA00015]|uniref:aminoglycoside phosphotransferase family protein n=1 Tax=Streptomyces sp. PKU-EA00015 TaxID=2748326 RepID=UPI0015A0F197|nr:aminoglycoside phosphotransferase family protein [Streptomyces sp. PKU-EA00015]NWF27778.1 hydroxyurea phosphotransferase [Streptomyces sp. PKU-EA00015]
MIDIPDELVASLLSYGEESGRALVAALPGRAEAFLDRWGLRIDGPSMYGGVSLVLPVVRGDGSRAVLKLQQRDEETEGEWLALRTWAGDGVVRLLECDADTGTLLLERVAPGRHLSTVADDRVATEVLAGLLARLSSVAAPEGLRGLGDVAARMLVQVTDAVWELAEEDERRLLRDCAAAVREVAGEPGDRLLHWDLHFDNILAAEREPWLAIDPKPLAGDPGFELLPALWNRFDEDAVLWRFDLLTEVLGLDRERARAWTLGRLLQNGLWEIGDGECELDERQVFIARALLAR